MPLQGVGFGTGKAVYTSCHSDGAQKALTPAPRSSVTEAAGREKVAKGCSSPSQGENSASVSNVESLKTSAPRPAPPHGQGCSKPARRAERHRSPPVLVPPNPVPVPVGASRGTYARAGAGSAPWAGGGQRSAPCVQAQRSGQRPPAGPASSSGSSSSSQGTMAGPARLPLASARPQPAGRGPAPPPPPPASLRPGAGAPPAALRGDGDAALRPSGNSLPRLP